MREGRGAMKQTGFIISGAPHTTSQSLICLPPCPPSSSSKEPDLSTSKQKIKISIGNEVINVLRNLNSVHVQQDSISSENKNCGIRK